MRAKPDPYHGEDLFHPRPAPPDAAVALTVTALNRRIKGLIERELGTLWVEGEISNYRPATSGHLYFTLKDETSQIPVAMFRGQRQGLTCTLRDGLKVRVKGEVTLYLERGQHQIIAKVIEEAGLGDLQKAFAALKDKLMREGLFAPERKRALPFLPRHIGIVTSSTGAAIHDMLTVLGRRFPNLHVVLAPTRVQGDGAANEIAAAIDVLNRRTDLQAIIVGRGGGSIEDLWAFNEEVVARAIARSRLPVISAVGHETDFTIADFVADLRAPTPSAAAELIIRPRSDLEEQLRTLHRRLAQALQNRTLQYRNRLTRAAQSYVFHEPGHLLDRHRQTIGHVRMRLSAALRGEYRERQQRVDELHARMITLTRSRTREAALVLQRLVAQVRALGPNSVLQRGYSISRTPDGAVITRAGDLAEGQSIITQFADGRVASVVTGINRKEAQ